MTRKKESSSAGWNETIQKMFAADSARTTVTEPPEDVVAPGEWPVPIHRVDSVGMLQLACRTMQKWGLYLRLEQHSDEAQADLVDKETRRLKPAPYLDYGALDGFGWEEQFLFFDTQADMEKCYWATVGPDGPTETNPYDGPAGVYALTCDPTGQPLNENT